MSQNFRGRSAGYLRLLAELEYIVANRVRNDNRTDFSRYPLAFPEDKELRGDYVLSTSQHTFASLREARYPFGANGLYVFQALDDILQRLAVSLPDPQPLYDLVDRLTQEAEAASQQAEQPTTPAI